MARAKRLQPLESPNAFPIGDGSLERLEFNVGGIRVMVHDFRPERLKCVFGLGKQIPRLTQCAGDSRFLA